MAVASIILPSALKFTNTEKQKGHSELNLSRFESILLLGLYASFLIFQLITHKHLYTEAHAENNQEAQATSPTPAFQSSASFQGFMLSDRDRSHEAQGNTIVPSYRTLRRTKTTIYDEEHSARAEEHKEVVISLGWCVVWLAIITVVIALLSEMVVDTIEEAHDSLGIPMPFLSTIVLPLVGNAAEHASAILFAYKNRMEITLGVAVGVSISLFCKIHSMDCRKCHSDCSFCHSFYCCSCLDHGSAFEFGFRMV